MSSTSHLLSPPPIMAVFSTPQRTPDGWTGAIQFCILYLSHLYFSLFSKICRFWVAALRKGGSCAIITNSCINFLIYCFVGRTFRRRFISTFSWVADNSNCCGNIVENCGETFPSPGTNNVEIPENITKSAKEEQETQRNLKKETSLVRIGGQSEETNPEEKVGKCEREWKREWNGSSFGESFKRWRRPEQHQQAGCFH